MKKLTKLLNNIRLIEGIKKNDRKFNDNIFETKNYKDCFYNEKQLTIDICQN